MNIKLSTIIAETDFLYHLRKVIVVKTAIECEPDDPKGNNLKILKFFCLSSATDYETFRNFYSSTLLSVS